MSEAKLHLMTIMNALGYALEQSTSSDIQITDTNDLKLDRKRIVDAIQALDCLLTDEDRKSLKWPVGEDTRTMVTMAWFLDGVSLTTDEERSNNNERDLESHQR